MPQYVSIEAEDTDMATQASRVARLVRLAQADWSRGDDDGALGLLERASGVARIVSVDAAYRAFRLRALMVGSDAWTGIADAARRAKYAVERARHRCTFAAESGDSCQALAASEAIADAIRSAAAVVRVIRGASR